MPDWAKQSQWTLVGYCGSKAHGTYVPKDDPDSIDDIDLYAVTVQPRDSYLKLDTHRFDNTNTNGKELDVVVNDIRKYVAMLRKGNPNVHSYLWTYPIVEGAGGKVLREKKEALLTDKLFVSILGYAKSQLKLMERGKYKGYMGEKRKELMKRYGYDTKAAAHAVRLVGTGLDLAKDGVLYVKPQDKLLSLVMDIKKGNVKVETALKEFKVRVDDLKVIVDGDSIFGEPTDEVYNTILLEAMERHWCPRKS